MHFNASIVYGVQTIDISIYFSSRAVSESMPKYISLALKLVQQSSSASTLLSPKGWSLSAFFGFHCGFYVDTLFSLFLDLMVTLAAMSVQEGKAFDKPISKHKIPEFIKVSEREVFLSSR